MTTTMRQIVKIDEEKCNGCGLCVPSCAEGALQIVDGKAKLVSEIYCDGLGACLGECPQDAITIEERMAEDFDEEAVKDYLEEENRHEEELPCGCSSATVAQFEREEEHHHEGALPCGCSSTTVAQFERQEVADFAAGDTPSQQSTLGHWPVQLTLVPPKAPFLQNAALVLAADCVPFAYAGFHQDFLKNHSLLIACPKLDDFQAHLRKLTDVLRNSTVKSLTVVHMEVPCCSGLVHMARQAIHLSGKNIPLEEVTIGVKGDVKSEAGAQVH
ncbi:ATP-binding protein [Chloroflexota bacterium]